MEETPRFLVNKHASTGASPVVSDENRKFKTCESGFDSNLRNRIIQCVLSFVWWL